MQVLVGLSAVYANELKFKRISELGSELSEVLWRLGSQGNFLKSKLTIGD